MGAPDNQSVDLDVRWKVRVLAGVLDHDHRAAFLDESVFTAPVVEPGTSTGTCAIHHRPLAVRPPDAANSYRRLRGPFGGEQHLAAIRLCTMEDADCVSGLEAFPRNLVKRGQLPSSAAYLEVSVAGSRHAGRQRGDSLLWRLARPGGKNISTIGVNSRASVDASCRCACTFAGPCYSVATASAAAPGENRNHRQGDERHEYRRRDSDPNVHLPIPLVNARIAARAVRGSGCSSTIGQ